MLFNYIHIKNKINHILKWEEKFGFSGAMMEELNIIKEKKLDRFDVDAGELNDVGYKLLNENKIKEAIALFTIQTQEFPQNANGFDSLGEAYMKAGNKKEAIKNYRKSVELNPKNEPAKKIIEELKHY